MATNNNLRDWANAFDLALVQLAKDILFDRSQRERRGRTTGKELRPPPGYGASKQIYTLRTLLPGVLTLAGLKPAEIQTIVAAFDKIKLELAAYRQWFNRYIVPLTK
jgi:hypothetical protein